MFVVIIIIIIIIIGIIMLAGTRHVENLLPHRILICGREMSGLCLFKKRYVHLTHQSPNPG